MSYQIICVDDLKLIDHIVRVCRGNLRKPCKCCLGCPFIVAILEIMDEKGWKYNKEAFK